jgi:CheY-like chemotaxis protein
VPARGGTEARRWLRFAVRDSGRGIAPDRLDRVFEPFVQEDPTIVRQYGGSGLGLTITARLVERMGGSIRLRSEVGVGSCFEFELPLLSEAPPAAAPRGSTASESAPVRHATAHAPLHVLLVDDSEVNRIVAEAQLLSLGCTVECVGDGGEALEVLKQRHAAFDAVLMDIQLPEIDGLSATRLLRRIEASHGWHRLPVIAATAFAMTEDRSRAERAGMDAYLSKPFQAAELAQVLNRVARRSTAPGPVTRPGTPLRVVS